MAINGVGTSSPSRVTKLLVDGATINAGAVHDAAIQVLRRRAAYVEVFCTQSFTIDIFASMDEQLTTVADSSYLYQPNQFTNRITGSGLGGSASVGRSALIQLDGVIGALVIRVTNNGAAAGTLTVKVALA